MPSVKDALAAMLAQAKAGEVDAAAQFVVYPGFFFPITGEALAAEGGTPAFDFTHRINMIPTRPPFFMMNTNFVWNVYSQVLDRRVTADDEGAQHGYAKRFLDAEAEMGEGRMTPQENIYFVTNAVPSDINAAGLWSSHMLDATAITAIAGSESDVDQQPLDRFNTLRALGDDMVATISFDRATLVLLRPWFDPSVFEWRFWDLPGETISDGASPPRGKMPAYISKLILIRNIRIALAAVGLPDVGPEVMYRRIEGSPAEPAPAEALVELGRNTDPAIMTTIPLAAEAGTIDQQIGAIRERSALELGLTSEGVPMGAQKFHVPLKFDVSAARNFATAELTQAEQRLIAASPPTNSLGSAAAPLAPGGAFSTLKFESGQPKYFGPSKKWKKHLFSKVRLKKFGAVEAPDPRIEEERVEAERLVSRWRNALSVLDQLEAVPADPTPYVAALVCDRICKSPNPDPSLFART